MFPLTPPARRRPPVSNRAQALRPTSSPPPRRQPVSNRLQALRPAGSPPPPCQPVSSRVVIAQQANPNRVGLSQRVQNAGGIQDGRPNLRGPGNFYRNQMGTEAGKDMFERYWLGKGDMALSKSQFNEIVKLAEAQGANNIKGTATTYNGQAAIAKVISFYGTPHANSLGSATLYYDLKGNAVGFYDYYNFDSKPWGKRSYTAEVKTRLVNSDGQLFGAKPFKITYP